MEAVIETGGKQYVVSENTVLKIERLKKVKGEEVEFDKVLMLKDENGVKIGRPFIEGVKVIGRVQREGKGRKIIVFKYKNKINYHKKRGHRQLFTEVKIEKIVK